jgi:hypothetical protein
MMDLTLQTPKWRLQELQKLLKTPFGNRIARCKDSGAETATTTARNNNSAATGIIWVIEKREWRMGPCQ